MLVTGMQKVVKKNKDLFKKHEKEFEYDLDGALNCKLFTEYYLLFGMPLRGFSRN